MNASPDRHPTDQALGSYGLGKLDGPSLEAIDSHLEHCPDCRKRVAEITADSFLGRVRDAQPGWNSLLGSPPHDGTQSLMGRNSPSPIAAETLPPGMADHPDYEIKRELGRGGMGVVYLAHNKLMGRDEVLKVMSKHLTEKPGVLNRFLREIRAVARLRHPNIVTAYSATRLGESIVFAMEYVEGLDLSRMVKSKGPLPVSHACFFAHQAALGLQHAHKEGLVHRDIKPANLMLSRKKDRATVKILDFGLAKAAREHKLDSGLTSEGQALGTPDFIAPEQILNAPTADIRADIYSLGGTFYYLLTGRPPFQANSLYDIYQAHISLEADLLNFVRPEVPAELAALVAKMLSKDPARRFQTPVEVAQALTPFFRKANAPFSSPKAELSLTGQSPNPQPVAPPASTPAQPTTVSERPKVRPRKAAEPTGRDPQWESLIDFRDSEDPRIQAKTSASKPRPPWTAKAMVIAASVFGLLAMGVIIITIRDKNGRETKISVPDDNSIVYDGPRKNLEMKPPEEPREQQIGTTNPSPASGNLEGQLTGKAQEPSAGNATDYGFVPLFNGKDLSNWGFPLGFKSDWTVQNGSIRGLATGNASTIVRAKADYGDFHLRMKIRTSDNKNKQILLRGHFPIDDLKYYTFWTGVLRVNGEFAPLGGCRFKGVGNIYTTDGLRQIIVPTTAELAQNKWQHVEVIATGNVMRMLVDGQEVSAFEDTQSRLERGQIGFRLLNGGQIEIRDIEVKELDKKGLSSKRKEEGRFAPLFNGKDLEGWTDILANGSEWKVVDGEILQGRGGGVGKPAVLVSRRQDFANFRLRAKARYVGAGFGWIEVRRSSTGNNHSGYFIADAINSKNPAIGSVTPATDYQYGSNLDWKFKPEVFLPDTNEWYIIDILVLGNRIATSIDGKNLLEYVDVEEKFRKGGIGLGCRGTSTIQFQEIMIEELAERRAPETQETSTAIGVSSQARKTEAASPTGRNSGTENYPGRVMGGEWRNIEGDLVGDVKIGYSSICNRSRGGSLWKWRYGTVISVT